MTSKEAMEYSTLLYVNCRENVCVCVCVSMPLATSFASYAYQQAYSRALVRTHTLAARWSGGVFLGQKLLNHVITGRTTAEQAAVSDVPF